MKRGLQKRLIRGGRLGHRLLSRVARSLGPCGPTSRPLCLEDLRDFPSPAIDRARVTPVGGRSTLRRNAAAFQSASSLAVLWPERFRGGCAFGAGLREPGLSRGDQRLRPCLEWRARKSMRQASPQRIVSASRGQPRRRRAACRTATQSDLDREVLGGRRRHDDAVLDEDEGSLGRSRPESKPTCAGSGSAKTVEPLFTTNRTGTSKRPALPDTPTSARPSTPTFTSVDPSAWPLHSRASCAERDLAAQGGSLADAPARIGLERGAALDDADFRADRHPASPRRPAAAADPPDDDQYFADEEALSPSDARTARKREGARASRQRALDPTPTYRSPHAIPVLSCAA